MLSGGCFLNSEKEDKASNPYEFYYKADIKELANCKRLKKYEEGFNATCSTSIKIKKAATKNLRMRRCDMKKHKMDSFKYLLEEYGIDDINKLSILTGEDVTHALKTRPESITKGPSRFTTEINIDGVKADSDKVITYAIAKTIITNIRRKKGESRFSPATRSHKEEVRKATNILHNQLMQFVKEGGDLSKDLYDNIENAIEDDLVTAQTTTLSRKNFRIGNIGNYNERVKALLPVAHQDLVDRKNNVYCLTKPTPRKKRQ